MINDKIKNLIKQLERNVLLLEADTRIRWDNISVCHEYLASFAKIIKSLEKEIYANQKLS